MRLIADSGSTKTDWILEDRNGNRKAYRTVGLNPYHLEDEEIKKTITIDLKRNFERDEVEEVFFYGSGCGADTKRLRMENVLKEMFENAKVNVLTDIMGSARAVLGNKEGIACILGTGSNSCLYDGKEIKQLVPSLGFIFGDEGSGSHLGKLLIRDYFKGNFSKHLREMFLKKYNLTDPEILDAIYRRPFPNRFLASFSQFIYENTSDKYIKNLLEGSFSEFIDNYIRPYKNHKKLQIGICGSVGFFFKEELSKLFSKNELNLINVIKFPVESLADYHSKI